MKILVTGSRYWTSPSIVRCALSEYEPGTLIHGDCRGLDRLAGTIAELMGWDIIKCPANWKRYGKAAGIIRNNKMLDLNPDLVLAFHENLTESKGTKHCIKEAKRRGIDVLLFTGESEPE